MSAMCEVLSPPVRPVVAGFELRLDSVDEVNYAVADVVADLDGRVVDIAVAPLIGGCIEVRIIFEYAPGAVVVSPDDHWQNRRRVRPVRV